MSKVCNIEESDNQNHSKERDAIKSLDVDSGVKSSNNEMKTDDILSNQYNMEENLIEQKKIDNTDPGKESNRALRDISENRKKSAKPIKKSKEFSKEEIDIKSSSKLKS